MPRKRPQSAQEIVAELRRSFRKTQILVLFFTLLLEPFRILTQGRRRWRVLLRQWGVFPSGASKGCLWIHAIGPGEARVAISLIRALPPHLQILLTSSSQRLIREAQGERVEITALPLPFQFVWRRFLNHYSPRQLILIEATDLSPVLFLHSLRRQIPTALVNGWVTKEWIEQDPTLLLLDALQVLCVRAQEDRELLAGIGVPPERMHLAGEMKLDVMADPLPGVEAQIQELAGERPILVAGSTHPDETPQIVEAFERLGGGDRALLLLAPRLKPQLAEELLRRRGLDFVRRSRFPASGRPAVVLLDTAGELASLYRLAAAAFVGYSLSPRGRGHNPIEPARFAVPIAVGPNLASFQFLAAQFDQANAWRRVANADELYLAWSSWLDSPELARQMGRRAADLVESQRGLATTRTLERLRPFLGLEDARSEPF